jgi:hypothetical protein
MDEKSYPNKTVFRGVMRHKKIVHEHFEPNFIAIIYNSKDNMRIRHCSWYKLYETRERFEMVEKHYITNEGFKQKIAKLENYLSLLSHQK